MVWKGVSYGTWPFCSQYLTPSHTLYIFYLQLSAKTNNMYMIIYIYILYAHVGGSSNIENLSLKTQRTTKKKKTYV